VNAGTFLSPRRREGAKKSQRNPLGRCLTIPLRRPTVPTEIIGIVSDARGSKLISEVI